MINTVKVTNYRGESMTFDLAFPEKSGFAISNIEGTGPVKANVNTVEMVTVDGSIYNSAHIGERNIVFTFVPTGTMGAKEYTGKADISYAAGDYYRYRGAILRCIGNHKAIAGPPNKNRWKPVNPHLLMEESRHLLYKYFPTKKPLTLQFTTETRICSIEGYVESNDPNPFSKMEEIQISVICPSPFFYSSGIDGEIKTDMNLYGLHFPLPDLEDADQEEDEFFFESISQGSEFIVYYDGDADTGMVINIDIVGTVEGVIYITNNSTGENFGMSTNSAIYDAAEEEDLYISFLAGDKLRISTKKGDKRVELTRDGRVHNLYNNIIDNSSWVRLIKGENRMVVSLAGLGGSDPVGFENLLVSFEYRALYEGV